VIQESTTIGGSAKAKKAGVDTNTVSYFISDMQQEYMSSYPIIWVKIQFVRDSVETDLIILVLEYQLLCM